MKRIILLIEVEDSDQQQLLYDALQDMIEERTLSGYFTLVDNKEGVEDLPEYMEYERNKLIPAIVEHERNHQER